MRSKLIYTYIFFSCVFFCNAQKSDTSLSSIDSSDIVLTSADENPEFPGGESALIQFLQKNIIHSGQGGCRDIVYVSIVITKEGLVTDPKILNGVQGNCEKEVLRIVSMMPKWKPGKYKGKDANVLFTIPFRFKAK